jgi:hypothetical protein
MTAEFNTNTPKASTLKKAGKKDEEEVKPCVVIDYPLRVKPTCGGKLVTVMF